MLILILIFMFTVDVVSYNCLIADTLTPYRHIFITPLRNIDKSIIVRFFEMSRAEYQLTFVQVWI